MAATSRNGPPAARPLSRTLAVVALPPLLGAAIIVGEQVHLYQPPTAIVLILAALTATGVVVRVLDARLEVERAARLRRHELETFFEGTPAAVHIKDLHGRFLMVNSTARRNLGKPDAPFVGTTVFDHLPAEAAREVADNDRRAIATLAPIESEVLVTVPGEPTRCFLSIRFPLLDDAGAPYATGGVALDITDRKAAQEEIVRLNDELSATIGELDAFAYSVSHDLRAPLRSATGFSQVLLSRYADALDPTGQDYLRRIQAASERMTQMIDDLLTLSRLGRTEPAAEPVDLSRMAHEAIEELRAAAPARDVRVTIADDLTARADPRLLRPALQNLLANAWKFTARCEPARIDVGAGPRSSHHAEFFVRDNGVGFDMAQADKLFAPFQRLHEAGEFPGTGIGLATAQRAIARQGGRVWATAAPDQGATFTFTLPLADERPTG